MSDAPKRVYWRRELPPVEDVAEHAHQIEATSPSIPNRAGERQEQWGRCYDSLMAEAERRIAAEVERLGGDCAHVFDEEITEKVDNKTNTYHLVGRFRFVLFLPPGEVEG